MQLPIRQRIGVWIIVAAGVFLIVMSPILLAVATWKSWKDREAASWPTVQGKITRSDVRKGVVVVRGKHADHFTIAIEYKYTVDGETYTSGRRSLFQSEDTFDSQSAKELSLRYPLGKQVTAYYSPQDPALSVLETGVNAVQVVFYVVPIIGLAVGIATIVGSKMLRRRLESAASLSDTHDGRDSDDRSISHQPGIM